MSYCHLYQLTLIAASLAGVVFQLYAHTRDSMQRALQPIDARLRPLLGGLVSSIAVMLGQSQSLPAGFLASNNLLSSKLNHWSTMQFLVSTLCV